MDKTDFHYRRWRQVEAGLIPKSYSLTLLKHWVPRQLKTPGVNSTTTSLLGSTTQNHP